MGANTFPSHNRFPNLNFGRTNLVLVLKGVYRRSPFQKIKLRWRLYYLARALRPHIFPAASIIISPHVATRSQLFFTSCVFVSKRKGTTRIFLRTISIWQILQLGHFCSPNKKTQAHGLFLRRGSQLFFAITWEPFPLAS